jgi:hypothetical protein
MILRCILISTSFLTSQFGCIHQLNWLIFKANSIGFKLGYICNFFECRIQFGDIMLKMNPTGRGFESSSGQSMIFQKKLSKIVKPMLKSAKSTGYDNVFNEITSRNR